MAKYTPSVVLTDFYTKLKPDTKNTPLGKEIKNIADFVPGIPAPVFTGLTEKGNQIQLSDYRGKYVLLEFWGSWCKPCREDNPFLISLYNRFKGNNFELIGIANEKDGDEGMKNWTNAILQDGLPWPNILYKHPANHEPLDISYRITSYPSSFLIDPDGYIIAMNLKGFELERKLTELVKK